MSTKQEKLLGDRLIQRKGYIAIRNSLEKFVHDYDHDRDSFELCVRLDSLDRLYENFVECQDAIEKLDKPESIEEHIEERVDFEQRFCKAKGFLLTKRNGDLNQSLNNSMQAAQPIVPTFHLRLPQIDLPKFNGDFSRWISFRDTFSSMVHANAEIPTVAKLQYLLQSLEGDAKKPFESVDIEADNYATTWDALLKRYDNRRFLKKQLFRALYDLPAVKQECAKRIHNLVDDYQRHVRALSKLGEPVNHWDTPLINLLSYKLDQATLRSWEERTSQNEDVGYDELIEFLYQRVRILNSVGPDNHGLSKVAGIQQKSFKQKVSVNTASTLTPRNSCPLACSDNHSLRSCPIFLGKNVNQRRELVSQKRLCWNCLSFGHQSRKCGSKFTCRTCHERHHSLLHDPSSPSSSTKVPASPAVQTNPSVSSTVLSSSAVPIASSSVQQPLPSMVQIVEPSGTRQVSMVVQTALTMTLLETVVLNIVDDYGNTHKARALLDSASMSNFITKPLAKHLYCRRSTVDVSVEGIGSSTQKINSAINATIESGDRTISMKLQFLVLKQPSSQLPTAPIDISAWKMPDVKLADPQFSIPGNIDIVIGSETYWELHTGRKIYLGEGLPWVVETSFGWAVTGPASRTATCIPQFCYLSTADDPLETALQKFWEMETIPSDPIHSLEESRCEQLYTTTTTRDSSGRYIVRLPRTEDSEAMLGESKSIADRRFLSLERRLQRDPATKDSYHRFMEDYLQLGHMKQVQEPVDERIQHCYIPHHVVFKESSTTTKVRVVYDASCKTTSGYSLNDTLLVGPVVQQDLFSIYLRFRTRVVAIVADVEKMYRQVLHHPADRVFLRIRYRRHSSDPIATYELQTVTYGTSSAPYLATRTLVQIAKDYENLYPAAVDSLIEDFYVDDLLSGTSDVESAIILRQEITAMLSSAGFTLKKWASNVQEVLADVPLEDLAINPLHDVQKEQTI